MKKIFETRFVPDRESVNAFLDGLFSVLEMKIKIRLQEKRKDSRFFPMTVDVYANEVDNVSLPWLGKDCLFSFDVLDYSDPENKMFATHHDDVVRIQNEPDSRIDFDNAVFDEILMCVDKVRFNVSFYVKIEGSDENIYMVRFKSKMRHELDHLFRTIKNLHSSSRSFKNLYSIYDDFMERRDVVMDELSRSRDLLLRHELRFLDCIYLFNIEEIPAHISEFYEELRSGGCKKMEDSVVFSEYKGVYDYFQHMDSDETLFSIDSGLFDERIKKYAIVIYGQSCGTLNGFIKKVRYLYSKMMIKMEKLFSDNNPRSKNIRILETEFNQNKEKIWSEIYTHKRFINEELGGIAEMPRSYKKMFSKINLINTFFHGSQDNTRHHVGTCR